MTFERLEVSPEVRLMLISEADRLLRLGLIREEPPPSFFPLVDSTWKMVDLGVEGDQRRVFVQRSIVRGLASRRQFDAVLSEWEQDLRAVERIARRAVWRAMAIRTIFLPVWLVFDRPFPSYPGSRYTQGMAIVGFMATLALVGIVVAAVFRNWIIVATCSYWWLGASLIRLDAKAQGLDV